MKIRSKKKLEQRIEQLEQSVELHRKAGVVGGIAAATGMVTNFILIVSQRNAIKYNNDQIVEMIQAVDRKLDAALEDDDEEDD